MDAKQDKSPELWRLYCTEFWAQQGGGWRSLPRSVSNSEKFLALSDQAVRLMIYLWDFIWLDRNKKDLVNNGVVSMPRNRMIAVGLRDENIDAVKAEIVNAGFFIEIAPYTFRLNDTWRNTN
ncbi:MAG: hypothetical protein ACLQPD_28175 [Desulfomonilaceae bacterium]